MAITTAWVYSVASAHQDTAPLLVVKDVGVARTGTALSEIKENLKTFSFNLFALKIIKAIRKISENGLQNLIKCFEYSFISLKKQFS